MERNNEQKSMKLKQNNKIMKQNPGCLKDN